MIFQDFLFGFDPLFRSARELYDRVQIWSGTVTIDELQKFINSLSQLSLLPAKNTTVFSVSLVHISSLQNSSSILVISPRIFFYIQTIHFHLREMPISSSGIGVGELPGAFTVMREGHSNIRTRDQSSIF